MFIGLFLILHAMVLGFMVLFLSVIAPSVFTALDEENAGKLLRKLFPRMFIYGLVLTLFACVFAYQAERGDLAILTMVSTFGFGFNAFYLTPLINEKRDALLKEPNASSKSFDLLHRLSVSIFMVQMIISIIALAWVHH
jgi:hypothetical protein